MVVRTRVAAAIVRSTESAVPSVHSLVHGRLQWTWTALGAVEFREDSTASRSPRPSGKRLRFACTKRVRQTQRIPNPLGSVSPWVPGRQLLGAWCLVPSKTCLLHGTGRRQLPFLNVSQIFPPPPPRFWDCLVLCMTVAYVYAYTG